MNANLMPTGPTSARARAVLCLGAAALSVGAATGLWELLASQAPGTPLYLGMLPGPIERLRREAFDVGILLWIATLLLGDRDLPRRVLAWWTAGTFLVLGTGLYAAACGMTGVQMSDLRPDASWVFWGKLLGRGLLFAGFVALLLRVLQRPVSGRPDG